LNPVFRLFCPRCSLGANLQNTEQPFAFMRLTIAIPTFNRNAALERCLERLLPQLTPDCHLLIIDNCSDEPVAQTLASLWERFPDVRPEIVRNRVNIGANANIMRCLEKSQTPWTWMVGDDDWVQQDAVSTILQTSEEHPDCVMLNFSVDEERKTAITTRGLEELMDKASSSADLPWIANSVYRSDAMLSQLKMGYHYITSMIPHVVTMLCAVGQNGKCFLSPRQIVNGHDRTILFEEEASWSHIPLALGVPLVQDLPFSPRVRRAIGQKLLARPIKLEFIVYQLLLLSIRHKNPQGAYYLFDQVVRRAYPFGGSIKERLLRLLYRALLRFPTLTAMGFFVLKRRRFGTGGEQFKDLYGRI
jgi:abequosyltransferase